MAAIEIACTNLYHDTIPPNSSRHNKHFSTNTRTSLQFTTNGKRKLRQQLHVSIITFPRKKRVSYSSCTQFDDFLVSDDEAEEDEGGVEFAVVTVRRSLFEAIRALVLVVLAGGHWWRLTDDDDDDNEVVVDNDDDEDDDEEIRSVSAVFVLRRMWKLIEDDGLVVYAAFGSLIVAALSEISMPSLIAASIFSAQSGNTVTFYRNVRNLVVLCFTSGICSGIRSGCFAVANLILVKRLKETLYSTVVSQDMSFFDREPVGDLTSRLGSDCQKLSRIIGNDIHLILRNTLQGTGALIHMLTLSWPLALSSLVICCILSTIFLVYGQYQKKAARLTQDFTAGANERSQETLSLMRTVRIYGAETKEIKRYKQWIEKLSFISVRESVAYGFWSMSFNTLYRSTQVLALLFGGMSILTGHTSPEELTKYVLYCEWLIYATWRVADSMSSFLQSVGASEKVLQLMGLLPANEFSSKGFQFQTLIGHVEFVDVSFCYASRITVLVLDHVNFSVGANEMVAIVGKSGSGKSTLVNLLLRLYEPKEGQIMIDGFPLTEIDIRWLREKIGYVEQEPHLFHMNIKSNIAYGSSKHIEQKDIERAAKQAYAHQFITSLPDGYNTLVDDCALSGGQKQRIAIARALLRDPLILILDEATSALDMESEYYITGVLRALKNDVKAKITVIVIAHRLSTIKAADKIIVMDEGRVIETGNHTDLMNRNSLYAKLVKVQMDVVSSA